MKTQHRLLITESDDQYHAEIALVEVNEETGEFWRAGEAEVLVGESVTDLKAKMESCRAAFWRQRLMIDSEDGTLTKDWPELEGGLDEFHRHEALDRTFIWLNQFCENVAAHPVILESADYTKRCEKITDLLAELHQDIGRENSELSESE